MIVAKTNAIRADSDPGITNVTWPIAILTPVHNMKMVKYKYCLLDNTYPVGKSFRIAHIS